MMLARRLSAATMALMLVLFPVALERCRTACLAGGGAPAQAAVPEHACHEAALADEGGPRMAPMARACGHSDEARTYESTGLAAGKIRALDLVSDVASLPGHSGVLFSLGPARAETRSPLPHLVLPRNSPLRL